MKPLAIEAHGARYLIEDPGGLIGKALRAGNPYERKVLEHIHRREFEGLAIDIGASIGNHTLWLAVVCGLEVIAVEPLDYSRLRRNVALNELNGRVRVWPIGLGERSERGSVTGPPAHVVGDEFPGDQVPIARLDDLSPTKVALIKIDVEGMEPEVLRGSEQTIARERPVIYAEAQDAGAHVRNAEILTGWGYEHTNTFGATPLEEWEPR